MNPVIRNSVFAAVFATLSLPTADVGGADAEQQQPIVISSGLEGRGYWGVATRLSEVAAELGFAVKVEESVGSLRNLQRLDDPDDPVGLALTQADALQYYLQDHPGLAGKMEILEYVGQECVFIITRSKSGIGSDRDLQQAEGHRIAIHSPDSGVNVTYEYMKLLEPGMGSTRAVYMHTEEAMESLVGSEPQVDSVMLVHRPKDRSPETQLALDRPTEYRFVSIDDGDLNDKLPTGEAVYAPLDIVLLRVDGEARVSVKTICTKGLLVASKDKLSPQQRRHLDQLVDYHWMRVYVTDSQ